MNSALWDEEAEEVEEVEEAEEAGGNRMEITESRQEEKILYQIEGRVDTNTSRELQSRILNGFQKSSVIILDMKEVAYVSSAGLRALLIGEKTAKAKGGRMEVIHVQDAVMEVLQMSGFDRILDIRD